MFALSNLGVIQIGRVFQFIKMPFPLSIDEHNIVTMFCACYQEDIELIKGTPQKIEI